MLFSLLKTALRNLRRHPGTSLINLTGLTLGISACLLLLLFLRHEWSFDSFHKKADRIYRIDRTQIYAGSDHAISEGVPDLTGEEAKKAIPAVLSTVRVTNGPGLLRLEGKLFHESLFYADPDFFTMFDFPLQSGNAEKVLANHDQVVISSVLAEKLYGEENPVGLMLEVDVQGGFMPFTIAGVMESLPPNTHFEGDIVLPFTIEQENITNLYGGGWGSVYSETFIELADGTDFLEAEQALNAHLEAIGGTVVGDDHLTYYLQPLKTLHVMWSNPRGYPVETKTTNSLLLGMIALTILLTACINFTTLSTGQATIRAREVGVRKVLGARRFHIIRQFWMETALVSAVALLLSFGVVELLLPTFNRIAESSFQFNASPMLLLWIAILYLGIVLIAGTYPALELSRFSPVHAFRGEVRVGGKRRLRLGLVLLQFTLSITLLASTLVMTRQMNYLHVRDLGYDGEQLVMLAYPNRDESGRAMIEKMRHELAAEPGVISVTGSSCAFSHPWNEYTWKTDESKIDNVFQNTVEEQYIDVLDIELLKGRFFDPTNPSDLRTGVVVNETFVRKFGIENPIGAEIPGDRPNNLRILGVVRDFHFSTLHDPIHPLVLTMQPFQPPSSSVSNRSYQLPSIQRIILRLAPEEIPATMRMVERLWATLAPDLPFEEEFVRDDIDRLYHDDRRWSRVVAAAAGLAIFLAVMGLLGIVSLHVAQRTREIGIRKALGATTTQILTLLNREITLLIIGANLLGIPLGFYLMNRYLENFAYHIDSTWISLLMAGALVLLLSWTAVSILTWRTANENPTRSLRHE